jgi:perosamine synthetase
VIPVNRPLIESEDLEAVTKDLKLTLISGDTPIVRSAEEMISQEIGVDETILVNSGTTAIDLVVEFLNISSNEEVVVPAFTIISTVSSILRRKAKLKLVDADPVTWSMNSQQALSVMSFKTRAILPVHIYGLTVDMDPILEKTQNQGIFVLEDAAEAMGTKYKSRNCGTLGDASVFSFYANKIVTGGEGGAICTNDSNLSQFARGARNLSHSPGARFVHSSLGYNFRLPSLSASLIKSQLSRLPELVIKKKAIGKHYLDRLSGHPWLSFAPSNTENSENSYWVFAIILNDDCPFDANQMQQELQSQGIETRRFFCPIHLQPVFKDIYPDHCETFPVSEKIWERGLYLPSGLGNSLEEIEIVCDKIWKLVK